MLHLFGIWGPTAGGRAGLVAGGGGGKVVADLRVQRFKDAHVEPNHLVGILREDTEVRLQPRQTSNGSPKSSRPARCQSGVLLSSQRELAARLEKQSKNHVSLVATLAKGLRISTRHYRPTAAGAQSCWRPSAGRRLHRRLNQFRHKNRDLSTALFPSGSRSWVHLLLRCVSQPSGAALPQPFAAGARTSAEPLEGFTAASCHDSVSVK